MTRLNGHAPSKKAHPLKPTAAAAAAAAGNIPRTDPIQPMQRVIWALENQRNKTMSELAVKEAECATLAAALEVAEKKIATLEAAAKA